MNRSPMAKFISLVLNRNGLEMYGVSQQTGRDWMCGNLLTELSLLKIAGCYLYVFTADTVINLLMQEAYSAGDMRASKSFAQLQQSKRLYHLRDTHLQL